jgi:twitching motility protein PilI
MNPFQTLLDIERNCRENAFKIPRQMAAERDWLGIAFKSSGFNFISPMACVSEVLRWPSVTELPSAQHWFKGTANLRGKILPMTDLQAFVTDKPHRTKSTSRVLVVDIDHNAYGFVVEQVIGIERFFSEEIKPVPLTEPIDDYLPFVEGAFEREGVPWLMISFNAIVQSAKFYHILSLKVETS